MQELYNNSMKTKIICAFPGTGKTSFQSNHTSKLRVLDLDSNQFTNGHSPNGQTKSDNFPHNYIKNIEQHLGKVDILFVSIHKQVLEELDTKNIPYALVYPNHNLKQEYLKRFSDRGDNQEFINLISKYWETNLNYLKSKKNHPNIILKSNQYISDVSLESF